MGSRKGAKPAKRKPLQLVFETVDQASDSIADEFGTKIDEETEPHVRQTQIRQNLLLVDPFCYLNRFDFHNDLLIE